MRRNFHRKLSASMYISSRENVGIIGIKRKRENRRVSLPFREKWAENCSHNVGKSLGEGLG